MLVRNANPTLLFVAPPTVGGFDVAVPMLQRLRQLVPGIEVVGLFRDSSARGLALRDPILGRALEESIDRHLILRSASGRPDPRAVGAAVLATVVSKAPLVLHAGAAGAGFFGRIAALARLRGGIVCRIPKTMTITLGRKDEPRAIPPTDDVVLCFSDREADQARRTGCRCAQVIGFPRLYRSWLDHVRALAPAMVADCAPWVAEEGIALVLLSSTVAEVFEAEELDRWFDEVIGTLRRQHPGLRLLIKPHPRQMSDQLVRLAARLDPSREIVTHLHTNALAAVCRFAVSCASSVILDVLAMGKPVVLHQRFTSHWMARHPEGSSYLHLGIPHSVDEPSLAASLAVVARPDVAPLDLSGLLGHREDLSVLTDFLLNGCRS